MVTRVTTKVLDIIERTETQKWQWVGMRWEDIKLVCGLRQCFNGTPRELTRPRDRPSGRCDKEIRRIAGFN